MRADKEKIKELKKFLLLNDIEPTLEPIQPILDCLLQSEFATEHIYFILKQSHISINNNWILSEEVELEEISFFYPVVHFISKHIILKEVMDIYLEKLLETESIIKKILLTHEREEVENYIEHFSKIIIYNGNPMLFTQKTYWRKNDIILRKEKSEYETVIEGVPYIVEKSKALEDWHKELFIALNEEYNALKPLDHVKYLMVSWGEYWKEYFLTSHGYHIQLNGMFELRRQVLFFITVIESLVVMKKDNELEHLYFHTDRSFFYKNKNLIPEAVRGYFEMMPSRPIFIVHKNSTNSDHLYLQNIGRNYKDSKYLEEYLFHLYACWKEKVSVFVEVYEKPMLFTYDGQKITRKYL